MRKINVVLFSSGVSEQNGILEFVKSSLIEKGYNCLYWRDLFASAHDMNNIALLPMLIKKIPSFDFAVLICEGHDRTFILRNGVEEESNTMRDNVLFEIGLCTMALGLSRTILLTDDTVRMPDDLTGYNNTLAIKRITYQPENTDSYEAAGQNLENYMRQLQSAVLHIDRYICKSRNSISPVVVGASASTACGYVSNFVLRTLESIGTGVLLGADTEKRFFKPEKIYMHIILPETYTRDTPDRASEIMKLYKRGCIPDARMRKVEFCYEICDDSLHIYDWPTTIVTSYDIARIILNLNADDEHDRFAEERFVAKELDLFENALEALLKREFVSDATEQFYPNCAPQERQKIVSTVSEIIENRVSVQRMNY